jgi:hypothetical protein
LLVAWRQRDSPCNSHPCLRCATVSECGKGSDGWFDDGGTCATSPFVPAWPKSTQQLLDAGTAAYTLDPPPFVQAASRCYAESACCKPTFQVFQMYVASVLYGCCKSIGMLHMLQASAVPNVSSVFQTYAASVFI